MTMIPDCRKKYIKDAYPYGTRFRSSSEFEEREINPYWEGHLKGADKDLVGGYDWAVETIERCFVNRAEDVVRKCLGRHAGSQVDIEVLVSKRDIDEYSEEEIASMSRETYLLKSIYSDLLDEMEVFRNEMITSFLDGQGYEE